MNRLILTAAICAGLGAFSSPIFAQDAATDAAAPAAAAPAKADDTALPPSAAIDTYQEAYEVCAKAADQAVAGKQNYSLDDWDAAFDKCMNEKGFGDDVPPSVQPSSAAPAETGTTQPQEVKTEPAKSESAQPAAAPSASDVPPAPAGNETTSEPVAPVDPQSTLPAPARDATPPAIIEPPMATPETEDKESAPAQ